MGYGDQTLQHLTIHDENDDDYFRWTAHQDGQLRVEIDLRRDSGAPELSLLNTGGTQLTTGTWSDNGRSLAWDVEAGQSYVIRVTPYDAQQQLVDQSQETGTTKTVSTNVVAGDSLNVFVEASGLTLVDAYTLRIDGVMPPVAADDRTFTEPSTPVEINLLLNDRSDDGELDPATLRFVSLPQHGQVQSTGVDGTVRYLPDPDFLGVDRFTYAISDDRGNESASNGDDYVSPVDSLRIINFLTRPGGDGEGESPHDIALPSVLRGFLPSASAFVGDQPEGPAGDASICSDAAAPWPVDGWPTGTAPATTATLQVPHAAGTLQRHRLAPLWDDYHLDLGTDLEALSE